MKTLIKTTAAISTAEIIIGFVAVVRNKYLAVTIGPEGFGIYGLLNSFFQMLLAFGGAWIATGTTKYVSEYYNAGKTKETKQTFTFSAVVVFGFGLIMTIFLVLGRAQIMERFLLPEIAKPYYLVFAVGFVWMSLYPVFSSVLQGMMKVNAVVWARISVSVVNLFLTLVLVYFFQLLGFFLSLVLSSILGVVLLFYFIRTRGKLRFTKILLKDSVTRNLMTFGGISLFLSLVNMGSQYLQRLIAIYKMDIGSVGIFQAGVALMLYIGLVNQGSAFYFLPKMSETMPDNERVNQINNYLFFVLLMNIPICVASILFGGWGIQLLYSDRFLPLSTCFFWFVLAQFFFNMGTAFQLVLVGTVRLGMHTISVIAVHSLYVLVPFFWIEKYGIASLGMGFVAGGLVGALLNFGYLRYRIGFRLSSRGIWLLILGVVGIIISKLCVDVNVFFRLVILAVFTGAVSFSLKQDEWLAIVGVVRNRLKGILGV